MNTMQINLLNKTISTKDNAESLRIWMGQVDENIIDEVFEFLTERELLSEQGKRVAEKFWQIYIHKP